LITALAVRSKLIKESSASDPNQPNRGVLYVVAGVAALVVAGGSGIFYNTEPGGTFSPIGKATATTILIPSRALPCGQCSFVPSSPAM